MLWQQGMPSRFNGAESTRQQALLLYFHQDALSLRVMTDARVSASDNARVVARHSQEKTRAINTRDTWLNLGSSKPEVAPRTSNWTGLEQTAGTKKHQSYDRVKFQKQPKLWVDPFYGPGLQATFFRLQLWQPTLRAGSSPGGSAPLQASLLWGPVKTGISGHAFVSQTQPRPEPGNLLPLTQ